MSRLLIKNAKALLGTHPAGTTRVHGAAMAQLPAIPDAWLLAEHGRITALGPMDTWPEKPTIRASDMAPGRTPRLPPPTTATALAEWCGSRNGGRTSIGRSEYWRR